MAIEHFPMVDRTASPSYENGIIDDRGVILAEKGLKISNLTHRARGLVDIGGQGLEVQNAGIDNHGTMNVAGPIRGHLHHFTNNSSFYADSMQRSSLRIDHWSNSGQVYLSQRSELFSQDSWNNTGSILTAGNSSVGCRKKPAALGVVISDGEIKAIIDEALDDAAFKEVFGKAAFISRTKKVVLDVLRHTDHYLNTITHHKNQYGHTVRTTETGYVFQRRTTEKTQKEFELGGEEFPEAATQAQQTAQGKRNFLNAFKTSLKDRLKKIGLLQASQNGIMAALLKGLSEAGLSDQDIEDIFGAQGTANNLLGLVSAYEQFPSDQRQKLQSELPEVGSFLSGLASQAQRLSLPIWQWAQRNGPEFVEGFCNLAILASRYTAHPVVAVPARVCTLGQLAPRAVQKLEQAQAFFSKKHEGGGVPAKPSEPQSLLWSSWKDYPKVVRDGKEYAIIGERLYTSHAVDRMQPSGLGAKAGGDSGRSFPPNLVEGVIRNGHKRVVIKDGKERTIHSAGSAEVVTEEGGRIVVTVNPFRGVS